MPPAVRAPSVTPARGSTVELPGDGKRCQDECSAVRRLKRPLAPFQLHFGLTEAGIKEIAGGAAAQRVLDAVALEREKMARKIRDAG